MTALYIILFLTFYNLDYRNRTSCIMFAISLFCTAIGVVGQYYVDYTVKLDMYNKYNEIQIKIIESIDNIIRSNYNLGDNNE